MTYDLITGVVALPPVVVQRLVRCLCGRKAQVWYQDGAFIAGCYECSSHTTLEQTPEAAVAKWRMQMWYASGGKHPQLASNIRIT